MSRVILELARQTLLLARADRLAWVVPAYAIACLALVPLASHLTLGSGSRGAAHLGLTLQWLSCCAVGGWLGLRSVGLDLDARTTTITLAGPVGPSTWLTGRALGAAAALAGVVVGVELVWCVVAWWRGLSVGVGVVAFGLALWTEGLVVAATVGLLSTRARPVVAAAAAAGLWVAGHLSHEYTALLQEAGAGPLAAAIYTVTPDLDRLDLTALAATGTPFDPIQVVISVGYGACWLVALGALTVASLRARDLA